MPSKSSSRNSQQKRLQITDTAGWTHIVKGSQAQKKQKYLTPVDQPRPTQVPKGLTIQQACDTLERHRRTIGESKLHGQAKDILECQSFLAELGPITRCVCLGLGSMTGASSEDSSWCQLAFLLAVLKILGSFPRRGIYHTISFTRLKCFRNKTQHRKSLCAGSNVQSCRHRSAPNLGIRYSRNASCISEDDPRHLSL
jgi:hypothetical protein